MNKVTVAANKDGNIIGISENNPEFGYIRVEQNAPVINEKGWLRFSKRSSLIKGKVEDLLQCNYKAGQEIQGRIVVVESLTPFNTENPDRDLKIAGETGVVCTIDDQPIYRQSIYTTNLDANDQLVAHTNAIEIREVQAAQNVAELLNTADAKL